MHRRLGSGFIVSADHGEWVYLPEQLFTAFRCGRPDSASRKLLKSKGLIVTKSGTARIEKAYRARYAHVLKGALTHRLLLNTMDAGSISGAVRLIKEEPGHVQLCHPEDYVIVKQIIEETKGVTHEIVTDTWPAKHIGWFRKNNVSVTCRCSVVPAGEEALGTLDIQRSSLSDPGIAVRHNAKRIWLRPLHPFGSLAAQWGEKGYSADEYLDFWKAALDKMIEAGIIEVSAQAMLLRIANKSTVPDEHSSPCRGVFQLVYHKNEIYPCEQAASYPVFMLGRVSQPASEILRSPARKALALASVNDTTACRACAYSPFCGLCPVLAYAERATIVSKIPDRRCRILTGMFDHIFMKLLNDERCRAAFERWITIARS